MRLSLIWLAALTTAAAVAADRDDTPAPRPRLTRELRRRVEQAAPRSANESPAAATNEGPVRLAPVEVKGSYDLIYRKPREDYPTEHPFTWRQGGALVKREGRRFTSALKFQYNPDHGGFDILGFSW